MIIDEWFDDDIFIIDIFDSNNWYYVVMADCDFFTDFNKDLTIEHNRILLEFKKSNYCLEM